MANGTKTPQDEDYYNRTQDLYNRELTGGASSAAKDQRNAFENEFGGQNYDKTAETSGSNTLAAKQSEENPDQPSGLYRPSGDKKQKISGKGNWLKKKGPIGIIIAVVLGGGAGITFLGSPALMIVQFKEILSEKFNTQLSSMDARTNRLMATKITGSTSGICGAKISIACKYNSLTKAQAQRFRDAGIKINERANFAPGRVGVASFEYDGKVISAQDFRGKLDTDPSFKTAVQRGFNYNPKFAGFASKGWAKVAGKIGVSKKPSIEGAKDDAERTKKLNDSVKNGSTEPAKVITTNDTKEDGKKYTQAEVDRINAANARIAADVSSGSKFGAEALDNVGKVGAGVAGSFTNAVKITGVADIGCQAYNSLQALSMAAKTVRMVQLARYAITFLSVADMIKAGKAKPEDVAFVGGTLAGTLKGAGSPKSATDSFGYRYAAYGDTGGYAKDTKLSSFIAGGGLTGSLQGVTSEINSKIGGVPKTTCATLSNPWVQAGSLIGGIALFATGIGTVAQLVKASAGVATQVGLSVALAILPDLLKDIVAGNVATNLSGEDSGNAVASGTGSMLSLTASANGNAPMTKTDAISYLGQQDKTIAYYNEQDRRSLSPLDATNKNTFVGSIVNKLIPLTSSISGSSSSTLTAFSSLLTSSLGGLVPKTSAASEVEKQQAVNLCQDPDYQALGVATDPFCNVISGIPPKYLDRDPNTVLASLAGQVDSESGAPVPGSKYEDFYNKCINRDLSEKPFGSGNEGNDDKQCVIDDSNANYYLFNVDQGVLDGMDNGYTLGTTASSGSSSNENSGNVNSSGWAYPVDKQYKVSFPFGYSPQYGAKHDGVDFPAPMGSPFYAAHDGTIENAQTIVGSWCPVAGKVGLTQNEVYIRFKDSNNNTFKVLYAHLSSFAKKNGDTVKAGDLIGYTGSTGCSTGPHAHFAVNLNGEDSRVDPVPYISK